MIYRKLLSYEPTNESTRSKAEKQIYEPDISMAHLLQTPQRNMEAPITFCATSQEPTVSIIAWTDNHLIV